MNRISTTTARASRLQALGAVALVTLLALTGAAWLNITGPAETPEVVKLERVVISGKRAPETAVVVQKLPRVVIEGRRDGTQVASACVAPAVC